jgi:lactoylglutathione lyase
MGIEFTSITVNTPNLENMLRFYEILGCHFTEVKVSKGGNLHRSCMHGFELSLLPVQRADTAPYPKVMMSFKVQDFDEKVEKILQIPGVFTMLDPIELPTGRIAMVLDPDGHSVELLAL